MNIRITVLGLDNRIVVGSMDSLPVTPVNALLSKGLTQYSFKG